MEGLWSQKNPVRPRLACVRLQRSPAAALEVPGHLAGTLGIPLSGVKGPKNLLTFFFFDLGSLSFLKTFVKRLQKAPPALKLPHPPSEQPAWEHLVMEMEHLAASNIWQHQRLLFWENPAGRGQDPFWRGAEGVKNEPKRFHLHQAPMMEEAASV